MNSAVTFPIVLAGAAGDHVQRLLELETLVLDPPSSLIVKLIGSGGLHPTAALAFLDVLSLLPPETKRVVTSYSHLLGAGDFALWLECALERDIRPRATVYVERTAPALDLEQLAQGRVLVAPLIISPADGQVLSRDHDICLSLISQHVDLGAVLNRVLTAEDLRELLLIDSYFVDQLLAPLAPEAPHVPSDPIGAMKRDVETGEARHHAD